MRGMKDSRVAWIGEIPEHWKTTRMRYVIKDYKAGPFGSSLITEKLLDEGNILVYTPENIAARSTNLDNNMYLPENRRNEMAQFFVKEGDIIFPIVGSLGRAMMITDTMPSGIINQRLARFSIASEEIVPDYFMWLFGKSSFYSTFIDLTCRGSIIVNLTKAIILDMPVLIPSQQEQKNIATYLDHRCAEIDSIAADIQSQIDTLEQCKRSVITETVTSGLNPDAEMKDSEIQWIGMMPAHWECIRGKYVLKYVQKPVREDDGVITCFRDGEVTLRSNRREDGFTMADKEIGYQGIDIGDLVVHGMDGFAGAIGISDSRGKGSPVLNVLETDQNKRYIMYFLRSMAYSDVFLALATGIRVRSCDLRWNKLSELFYPIPPLEEQEAIVAYIDDVIEKTNAVIADKKAQLETLEEYKKSLIFEYVTGKKEVPVS